MEVQTLQLSCDAAWQSRGVELDVADKSHLVISEWHTGTMEKKLNSVLRLRCGARAGKVGRCWSWKLDFERDNRLPGREK